MEIECSFTWSASITATRISHFLNEIRITNSQLWTLSVMLKLSMCFQIIKIEYMWRKIVCQMYSLRQRHSNILCNHLFGKWCKRDSIHENVNEFGRALIKIDEFGIYFGITLRHWNRVCFFRFPKQMIWSRLNPTVKMRHKRKKHIE